MTRAQKQVSRIALWTFLLASPAIAFDPTSPYGVTAFIPSPTRWQAMQDAMIVWNRCEFSWRNVETSQNVFNWSQTDDMVNEANARGLQIYAGLGYTPTWASSGGQSYSPPTNPADWADYVTQAVNRYKTSIHVWEIWNEPNLSQFWGGTRQQYIDNILKVAADAIHAADPTAKVAAPEISRCCSGNTWMTDVLNQAGTKIDIISHHQYDYVSPQSRLSAATLSIDQMHNMIVSLGYGNKPIWVSESGWASDEPGLNDTIQGQYLVQMLVGMETRPWFQNFMWYQIWEGPSALFGLLRQDESRKPSWQAYHDYIFASNWGPQTPFGGTARPVPGMIQAEDFDNGGPGVGYGDSDASNSGGAYRPSEQVDIEGTGDTGGGYNVGWTAGGEFLKYTVNVASTGTYSIQLRTASPSSPSGTYHIQVGGNNKTGVLTLPVTGGWQTYQTTTISNISLNAGTQVLKFYVDSGGFNFNWINVISGTPPPGSASNPNPASGATSVNRNADLSWTAGSGATSHDVLFGTTNPPVFVINQTGTTYDPGLMLASTTYFWRIDEKNTGGTTAGTVWSFTTASTVNTLNVKAVTSAITIDGNSSDWVLTDFVTKSRGGEVTTGDIALVGFDGGSTVYRGAFTGVLPTSATDHTAKVYSRHDATYQYFLVRIDDNQIQTQNPLANNWANDCVEFFIDPSNDGGSSPMSNSASDIQLTIDAINQKNVYMCTAGYTTQVLNGVTSAVTTDGTGWWCEVRIQKTALDPDMPASGVFGVDFNFRDNDNNNDPALTTVYTWSESSTAGFPSKIPNHWGDATLAALAPGQATNPSPANGATGQGITTTLSWTAGSGATSHDVRFGTANPPPFIQNQAGTTYNPGTLNPSTTYFWRIDEKNGSGTTTGVVWSFTTAAVPNAPTVTAPSNGGTVTTLTPTITWIGDAHDQYQVRISQQNDSNTSTNGWDSGTVTSTGSSAVSGTLRNYSFYYVFVRLHNAAGGWGAWSAAGYNFTVNTDSTLGTVYLGNALLSASGWSVYDGTCENGCTGITTSIVADGGSNVEQLVDASTSNRSKLRYAFGNVSFDTGASVASRMRATSIGGTPTYNLGISNGNVGGHFLRLETFQVSLVDINGNVRGTFALDATVYHKYQLTVKNTTAGNNATAAWKVYVDGTQRITFTGAGTDNGFDGYMAGHAGTGATGTWWFDNISGRSDGEFSPSQWDPVY